MARSGRLPAQCHSENYRDEAQQWQNRDENNWSEPPPQRDRRRQLRLKADGLLRFRLDIREFSGADYNFVHQIPQPFAERSHQFYMERSNRRALYTVLYLKVQLARYVSLPLLS